MARRLTASEQDVLLQRAATVLARYAGQCRTLSYLELADAVAMPGPRRIHRTTRLLEILMQEDSAAGRPIRSALVLSRVGQGLPASGFFDRAVRLGLFDGKNPEEFHRQQLEILFADSERGRDQIGSDHRG